MMAFRMRYPAAILLWAIVFMVLLVLVLAL